jgi:hypothetical protein
MTALSGIHVSLDPATTGYPKNTWIPQCQQSLKVAFTPPFPVLFGIMAMVNTTGFIFVGPSTAVPYFYFTHKGTGG